MYLPIRESTVSVGFEKSNWYVNGVAVLVAGSGRNGYHERRGSRNHRESAQREVREAGRVSAVGALEQRSSNVRHGLII